jgi:glycosyltransferase involved in cell wall biosynthesis
VFEYMSLGIPFVQFDLAEGRRIAGGAALYATNNSPAKLAGEMARLLEDATLRQSLAAEGQARAKALLRWETERSRLLGAYELALSPARAGTAGLPAATR